MERVPEWKEAVQTLFGPSIRGQNVVSYHIHHLANTHVNTFLQPGQSIPEPSVGRTLGPEQGSQPGGTASAGPLSTFNIDNVDEIVRLAAVQQHHDASAPRAPPQAVMQAIAKLIRPHLEQQPFSAIRVNGSTAVSLVHGGLRAHLQKKSNEFRNQLVVDRLSHLRDRNNLSIDRVSNSPQHSDSVQGDSAAAVTA